MERGSKRKAAAALPSNSPTTSRASKRQKTPDARPPGNKGAQDAQDAVTLVGLDWVAFARRAKDSLGNPTATQFLTLPSKKEFPEYYAQTALPLAIDTIEQKILKHTYPDISAVESDVRRMIQNAKDYNEPGSDVFLNAERLRKLTHNFMKGRNPAYKTRDYVAKPTPVPTDAAAPPKTMKIRLKPAQEDKPTEIPPTPPIEPKAERRAARSMSTAAPRPSIETTPVPTTNPPEAKTSAAEGVVDGDYEGKTFQEAQELLLNEMAKHRLEGDEIDVFEPFVTMPSRKLTEYYSIIKDPTSINKVMQKVRGFQERGKYSGVSDFRTWDAFANEVARIWHNARLFNEDGSEIYALSEELETYFNSRLAEAKKHVEEPPQPTLKLNIPSKSASVSNPLKLRLGSQKASPAPPAKQTPGPAVAVAEANGAPMNSPALPAQVSPLADSAAAPQDNLTSTQRSPAARLSTAPDNVASSAPELANGVKAETSTIVGNALDTAPAGAAPQQAGPEARVANGASAQPPNGTAHASNTSQTSSFDSKFRKEGQDESNAIIHSLQISSHPTAVVAQALKITIPAHSDLTQQIVTLNIHPSQSFLQFTPHIAGSVCNNPRRPYRLFLTASNAANGTPNGVRLSPSSIPRAAPAPYPPGTVLGDGNPGPLPYDLKLGSGLNRVEVECVAVAEGALGAGTLAKNGGLEMERFTVLLHLLRA